LCGAAHDAGRLDGMAGHKRGRADGMVDNLATRRATLARRRIAEPVSALTAKMRKLSDAFDLEIILPKPLPKKMKKGSASAAQVLVSAGLTLRPPVTL